MIIRRATQVVAGTTMPRSATRWLPRAWPEGPREAGIGQRRGCFDRTTVLLGRRHPATGSHLPFGRRCSALRGRTIRVVAFRASPPAKPPPRQRRFIQRFPSDIDFPGSWNSGGKRRSEERLVPRYRCFAQTAPHAPPPPPQFSTSADRTSNFLYKGKSRRESVLVMRISTQSARK